MVLMADAVEGEEDLTKEAQEDLDEMGRGTNAPTLNVFVQRHRLGGATRQHVGYGDPEPTPVDAISATNGSALTSFMHWACDKANHEPDNDRILLVLWGHSYDFAIGRAETPTGIDGLDFAELADILQQFKVDHGRGVDIVGFDACQVATVEMAYELRDVADYLLASQIGIPLPGWPYHRIFDRLKDPKGDLMGPGELGSYIVRRYCETYRAEERTVSLTMLDLRDAAQVAEKAETLTRELAFALDDEADLIAEVLSRSQTIDDEPFVDVADLCLNLLRYSGHRAVRRAAEDLGDRLISPGPVFGRGSLAGVDRPFIVEHGRNACETARLHGLSLYAPGVAPDHDVEKARRFYDKFTFVQTTVWGDIVRRLA